MGFRRYFFVFGFVSAFLNAGGVLAAGCSVVQQICSDGQYNKYGCQAPSVPPRTGYSCVSCPAPFNKSGTTTPQTINDCYTVVHCGADEWCTAYYNGQTSCQDGTGGMGNHHLEIRDGVAVCVENMKQCKDFTNHTENNSMNCAQSYQQGQAVWKPDRQAWDTKNCHCNMANEVIVGGLVGALFMCDDFNAGYFVSEANRYLTTSTSADIIYTMERMYCAKCHPGRLPVISESPNNGIYIRPDNNGTWGVGTCTTVVPKPYYADGCVINFNLADGADAITECKKSCPVGFGTESDGATSMTSCLSDGVTEYEDSTGWFTLGNDVCQ